MRRLTLTTCVAPPPLDGYATQSTELGTGRPPPPPFCAPIFCAHSHRLAYPQMPQLYLMPEVLAGLMAGFVLVLGTCIGVNCLTDIQAPRTFPKAEEKKSL